MDQIIIKKGYNPVAQTAHPKDVYTLPRPQQIGILPEHLPNVKPKLTIQEGDVVKVGQKLFEDKNQPGIQFVAPGAGKITKIIYGARRVIKEIVIQLDDFENFQKMAQMGPGQISSITPKNLIQHLLDGGMWPFIKSLPYRMIANPNQKPSAIYIPLDQKDLFHPSYSVYLNTDNYNDFNLGYTALKKICDNVILFKGNSNEAPESSIEKKIKYFVQGPYPASDPGVVLYHLKKGPEENNAWYIDGQDVLALGKFLSTGCFDYQRIIGFSDFLTHEKRYFYTRIGAPLNLFKESKTTDVRWITGGIFKGRATDVSSYLGWYEKSAIILNAGDQPEFLGFVRPGLAKSSYWRVFLSAFQKSKSQYDTGIHGSPRACVNCGACTKVCPVDILPQFTIKAILAQEVEESLSHGLLDCVECGLCAYVCPSKIELVHILKQAKYDYWKEQVE